MIGTTLQSLITPWFSRRYIGRHRARATIRFIFGGGTPSQRTG
jgi:hypothetical protein